MIDNDTLCFKVSDTQICLKCKSKEIIKNGFTKNRKQQYHCKSCGNRFINYYTNKAYHTYINKQIITLTKEGLGIRSTARVLQISTTTLLRRIIAIANGIKKPIISMGKSYEVDEMRTYIKKKTRLVWIVYALEKETKEVVSFNIGARTNATLNVVIKTLKSSKAAKICTDGLKNYKYLINPKNHITKRFSTNHIERNNLSLRTHLNRLNRRTICFSRSFIVLVCIVRIYFWG